MYSDHVLLRKEAFGYILYYYMAIYNTLPINYMQQYVVSKNKNN